MVAARSPQLIGETYFAAHEEHLPVIGIAKKIVEVLERGSVKQIEWPDERRRIEVLVADLQHSHARLQQRLDQSLEGRQVSAAVDQDAEPDAGQPVA